MVSSSAIWIMKQVQVFVRVAASIPRQLVSDGRHHLDMPVGEALVAFAEMAMSEVESKTWCRTVNRRRTCERNVVEIQPVLLLNFDDEDLPVGPRDVGRADAGWRRLCRFLRIGPERAAHLAIEAVAEVPGTEIHFFARAAIRCSENAIIRGTQERGGPVCRART